MIGGWAGTGLDGREVHCAEAELAIFNPPTGLTCERYLTPYFQNGAPGLLQNPSATSNCEYCPFQNANQYLALSSIYPSQRFRNLGIGFGFIIFNIFAAISLYYFFRIRKVSFGGPAKLVAKIKGLFTRGKKEQHGEESKS